ncbi:ferrochelatase [Pseudoroseicyclus tamaricis]|uniref:Ferrochelatase n=1 Tax=Pseudoroseicyclus tamaricis TaxID=2705421 RepID=A0A6B2K4E4_9RHOB|nr:ferrochelatase [Pseudoroseicyclus tamaricis]NDV02702.1 ferrochelatase [Pseudoroseicyclus tamaricis]
MHQLPPDHPRIPSEKTGILLANLGTPDSPDYWPMRRYLSEFLSDKRVVDYPAWLWQPILQGPILARRPSKSGANYRMIWNNEANESPLMTITKAQTAAVAEWAEGRYGDKVMVEFAMRYGNPSTRSVLRRMVEAGCSRLLFFPLYPHYAGATVATANDELFRGLMKEKWQPTLRIVPPYFDEDDYIAALANSVRAGLAEDVDILLCSYHGLPERYLREGDPYHCQCHKTTRRLREALGWDETKIKTTFQSKFGPESWLQPYTVEEVARQAEAGNKRVAVIAPAFSSDCIETLEEIQGEIQESFTHAGGERFTYIPCLNAGEEHMAVLTRLIETNLAGWTL